MFKKLRKLQSRFQEIGALYKQLHNFRYEQRRIFLEDKILNSSEQGISTEKYADCEFIVSLTSYGRRLHDVCFAIESMMQQTLKPNKIILWLFKEDADVIPQALKRQQKRGLQINIIDEDIRSYTKLIPALEAFPDDGIITIDDDAIYDYDIIERLIGSYKADPSKIHACRTHVITFNNKGEIKPYMKWKQESCDTKNCRHLFPAGVGSVLYPPHSLDDEVLNKSVFTDICPTADDVWFFAMALKKGTQIKKVVTRNPKGCDFITNEEVQDLGLFNINNAKVNRNDIQLKAVLAKYDLFSKL